MSVIAIVATVVVVGAAMLGAIWIAARPSRTGTPSLRLGVNSTNDEARDEIEFVFPGATQPVDPAVEGQSGK